VKTERPRQSKFMGHVYKIRWLQEVKNSEGDPLNGQTDNDKAIIEMEEGMVPSKERETLIHEVLHQILESYTMPDDMEEGLVTYLGAGLASHIQDNPLFWRYASRRLKPTKDA
jgi:hypothetical protein